MVLSRGWGTGLWSLHLPGEAQPPSQQKAGSPGGSAWMDLG